MFTHDDITRDFTVHGLHPASYSIVVEQKKLAEYFIPVDSLQERNPAEYSVLSAVSGILFASGSGCNEFVCPVVLEAITRHLLDYSGNKSQEDRVHLFDLTDVNGTLLEYLAGVPLQDCRLSGDVMSVFRALVGSEGGGCNVFQLTLLLRYMQR